MVAPWLHGPWASLMEAASCWWRESSFLEGGRTSMKSKQTSGEARFAYEGLDRAIHERARLSILTSLITNPKGLTFSDLKELCALTDGNLSRHLSVLEKARMVEIAKG